MKEICDSKVLRRVEHPIAKECGDEHNGAAFVKLNTGVLAVLFSDGEGWDHVSVSRRDRTPTWDEMCAIKDLFFDPDDCVVQFHPPQRDYINNHPHCLHLWRLQDCTFPMPPIELV